MSEQVEQLYRRYGPMVLRRCRQLLGEEAQALDAMQDVFVQFMQHDYGRTLDAPSSLLYRMATNVCLNVIRAHKRQAAHHHHDGEETLLQRIASSEDIEASIGARDLLQRLFRRHPESSQTIAVLHLYDGMTLEAVAQTVGMSVSGVRKRLAQLREHLHELQGEM